MKGNIFLNTPNFSFSAEDEAAEIKFRELQKETRSKLPKDFYSGTFFCDPEHAAAYLDNMK
jgi:hypothetical protein